MNPRTNGTQHHLEVLSQYLAGVFQNLKGFVALRALLVIALFADEANGEIEVEDFAFTFDGGDRPTSYVAHDAPLAEKTRRPPTYVEYISKRMGMLVPEQLRDLRTILRRRGPMGVANELLNDVRAAAYRIAFDLEQELNVLRTPATSPFTDGTYLALTGEAKIDADGADPAKGLRLLTMAYADLHGVAPGAAIVHQRMLDAFAIAQGVRDYMPRDMDRNLAEDGMVQRLMATGLRIDPMHLYVADGYKTTTQAWAAPAAFSKVHPNQIFLYNRGEAAQVTAARGRGAIRTAGPISLATFIVEQNIDGAVNFGDTGLNAVDAGPAVEVLNAPNVQVFRARQEVLSNPDVVKVGGEIEASVSAIMADRTGLIVTEVMSDTFFDGA